MGRAPFDNTCDVYEGPGGTSPGALVGTCACRLVLHDDILVIGANSPPIVGWITMEDIIPVGPWKSPFLATDPRLAYQIAVPSGTGVIYWAFLVEQITHGTQPTYQRAHLLSLPLPTTSPDGLTCATSKPAVVGVANTATGVAPGDSAWWEIDLPPGAYTVTITTTASAPVLNLWQGDCSALTLTYAFMGSGSYFLLILSGDPLEHHFEFNPSSASPEDITWDIT